MKEGMSNNVKKIKNKNIKNKDNMFESLTIYIFLKHNINTLSPNNLH